MTFGKRTTRKNEKGKQQISLLYRNLDGRLPPYSWRRALRPNMKGARRLWIPAKMRMAERWKIGAEEGGSRAAGMVVDEALEAAEERQEPFQKSTTTRMADI